MIESPDTPSPGASRRRLASFAGVGVGLLVVVFAVLRLVGGGSPEPLPPLPSTFPTGTPTATASPLPRATESALGRDPFRPLVTESSPGASPSASPSATPTATPTSSEARRVKLVDVFLDHGERVATVLVDGSEYTVAPGETFADSFELLSLTSSCGNFVFGDERFTLCLGQEAVK